MLTMLCALITAHVTDAYAGKSGRTVTVVSARQGTAVLTVPTLTADGQPVPLLAGPILRDRTSYIKDPSGAVVFRVEGEGVIRPGQVLSLDAPAGWMTGAPEQRGVAVRNRAGLNEFADPVPTMSLGINITSMPRSSRAGYGAMRDWAWRITSWQPARAGDPNPPRDEAGYPTADASGLVTGAQWMTGVADQGYLPALEGVYTVTYDALDPATVVDMYNEGAAHYTVTALPERDRSPADGKGMVRAFLVMPAAGRVNKFLMLRVRITHPQKAPRIANLRVYPPGNDPDPDPFAPEQHIVDQLSIGGGYGPHVVRWVDSALDWAGASNVVEAADLPAFGRGTRSLRVQVTSIRPPAATGLVVEGPYGPLTCADLRPFNPGSRWVAECLTATPHGFTSGQYATLDLPAAVNLTAGGFPVRLADGVSNIWVTGPQSFVISQYDPDVKRTTSQPAAAIDAPRDTPGFTVTVVFPPNLLLPPEFCAATASRWKGCALWLQVPLIASDACVDELAGRVLKHLKPGHKLLVELSNECWNGGFKQSEYCRSMTLLMSRFNTPSYFAIKRSGEVAARVRAVFAAAGREGDVRHVLAWQWGGMRDFLVMAAGMGVHSDIAAGAWYANLYSNVYDAPTRDWSAPMLHDLMRVHLRHDPKTLFEARAQKTAVEEYSARIGKPVQHYTYEGSIERPVPTGPATDDARIWDTIHHPDAYDSDRAYYELMQSAGVTCHTYFGLINEVRNQATWMLYDHQFQQAGRGDGSDGRPINRPIGSSGTWNRNLSVRGQAWQDWRRDALLSRVPED